MKGSGKKKKTKQRDLSMEKRAEKKSKQKGNETFYVLKDTKSRNK